MAETNYILNRDSISSVSGFENISQEDLNLINQYQINNLFDTNRHFIEVYIADFAGNILNSDKEYSKYRLLGTAQSAGRPGASILTIDPIQDSRDYGFGNGGVKLRYNFLNDLFTSNKSTTQFFISAISPDRTEIQLKNLNLNNDQIISYTSEIRNRLSTQAYFEGFRLNFAANTLLLGINIDTLAVGTEQTVVVKLYEPLPTEYRARTTLSIVEVIADPVTFQVDATFEFPETPLNRLRSPNFNLDIADNQVIPTQYFGYNDLFSYPVSNTNNQLFSLVNERGIELSIDHTDYANFIHFSSAYERLANFKYKLELIQTYTNNLTLVQNATSQSIGTTGSIGYYENLITGVVNNFDHYERYLYYQSSSYAWPKSNSTQPYVNFPSTASQAISWYANQLAMANFYDVNNGNILINTIPVYLREDSNNENYLTFVHMIGQHFDNLWIYAKAVTDKYDTDNRINNGIPKDLVGEALTNFGVKLYTSNKSIEDLFGSFIGQGYQSGSEVINTYVTGSVTGSNLPVEDISFDNYTKEVQKRIYHNLSHIIKTKGTERGVRALINCFGIPSDFLKIKVYGGRYTDERPFYGDFRHFTSSLGKIRLDNTGSIAPGNTVSQLTSIYKRDKKYSDDFHRVEIGFSPVDNIDNLIVSYSLATGSLSSFSIDDYIGDPRSLNSLEYGLLDASGSLATSLDQIVRQVMSSSTAYNVQDYVRLIKFFDNVVFKMVRDYVPGRSTIDTGIIIKPHLLQRNKARSPRMVVSQSQLQLTASIDIGFMSGSHGSTFGGRDQYSTITYENPDNPLSNYRLTQTPFGLGRDYRHGHEETKYDGDFSGSTIVITDGNLTRANTYTQQVFSSIIYDINPISSSGQVCLLSSKPPPIGIEPYTLYPASHFFNSSQAYIYYTASVEGEAELYPIFPYAFDDNTFQQYDQIRIQATSSLNTQCRADVIALYASCSLGLNTANIPYLVNLEEIYDLTTFFTPVGNPNLKYYVNGIPYSLLQAQIFTFGGDPTEIQTIEIRDNTIEEFGIQTCRRNVSVQINGGCPITLFTDGGAYNYNDTVHFSVSEGVIPGTVEYIVQRGGGTNLKSLLYTGANSPNTRFDVALISAQTGQELWIKYGPDPNTDYDSNTTIWTGNEILTLVHYTDSDFWGWKIEGDDIAFQSGDRWETITPSNFSNSLGDTDIYTRIQIRAFSISGNCFEIINLIPPPFIPPALPYCQEGVHYVCQQVMINDALVWQPVPNPTNPAAFDACVAIGTECLNSGGGLPTTGGGPGLG